MGYSTAFRGQVMLSMQLTEADALFLQNLNKSRRMKRDIPGYGVDGEFYVDSANDGDFGQTDEKGLVDFNTPPSTQPGLWCHWVPSNDNRALEWDGGEKAYYVPEWLVWIINRYLEPRGYVLNGVVEALGEEHGDHWGLKVENNRVYTSYGNSWQEVKFPKASKIPMLEGAQKVLPPPEK